MKTLTLFEAFEHAYGLWMRAAREHYNAVRASEPALAKEWDEEIKKRHRQMQTFRDALTKRLQEQEEELACSRIQLGQPGTNTAKVSKYFEKEKTNE